MILQTEKEYFSNVINSLNPRIAICGECPWRWQPVVVPLIRFLMNATVHV